MRIRGVIYESEVVNNNNYCEDRRFQYFQLLHKL